MRRPSGRQELTCPATDCPDRIELWCKKRGRRTGENIAKPRANASRRDPGRVGICAAGPRRHPTDGAPSTAAEAVRKRAGHGCGRNTTRRRVSPQNSFRRSPPSPWNDQLQQITGPGPRVPPAHCRPHKPKHRRSSSKMELQWGTELRRWRTRGSLVGARARARARPSPARDVRPLDELGGRSSPVLWWMQLTLIACEPCTRARASDPSPERVAARSSMPNVPAICSSSWSPTHACGLYWRVRMFAWTV